MSDNIKSNISNERLLSVRNVSGTNEELINLSSKFPNVLFYADNTSAGVLKNNNTKDLYLGGFKYTRFHGLGKNMVTIGENRIILSFDESSGLLSISLNSSIDAMWLCGIDDKNSISSESSLSEIKPCIIGNDSGYNDISKYIYRYNYGVIDNTDRHGMVMFNRGNSWDNGTFVTNDDNDSMTLLFALVSESNDLPNIQFTIQNNKLVSFNPGQPFMIKTPSDEANKIIRQVGLSSLSDKQYLYICPIKILIINSGVFSNNTVKIDPSVLIPVEDNDTYRSNFYQNSIISSSTDNVPMQTYDDITNDDLRYDQKLQTFNIFDTSQVTSSSDNVLLKCNMFVESTIRTITLTGDNISTNNEEFKIRLNIGATKNANYINSSLFNNDELVKFLIDKGIMTFAIQIKNNNGSTFETDEINDETGPYGYIKYEDGSNGENGSYVYTCKKGTLLAEGLKSINIFLLVKNSDNDHPKFPLIKFISKSETESAQKLYPLFEYDNLSYFIQPNNNNLSLSKNNSRCIAARNVVNITNSNWIYVSYVSNFNGEITDEHLTDGINYTNVINRLNDTALMRQKLSFNEIVNGKNVLIVYTGSQINNIHVSLNIMKVESESETNNTSTYIPIDSRYISTGNSNNLSWIYIKHNEMGMITNPDSDIRYVFF